MAKTYEPIATQTLVSDSATVTFSNIPDTYTDLVIIGSARSTRSAANDDIRMRFNDDTNNNYSATMIRGTGATADSARDTNQSYIGRLEIEADSATSDVFTSININLISYSNTNVFKTVIGTSSSSTSSIRKIAGLYRSTNSINIITLYALNGSLKSGSTFSLYGIKAKSPVLPLLSEDAVGATTASVTIDNYDAGLTYTATSSAGTATVSTNTVSVTGLNPDSNVDITVTATNGANSSSSNTISITTGPTATGGTVTTSDGYRYHTFTSSDNFVLNASNIEIEYLIVAGGGSGGKFGGGGGGGGLISGSSNSFVQDSYPIVVGSGGAGVSATSNGNSGTASSAFSLSATGGGGGARQGNSGISGGSGGGGGAPAISGPNTNGGGSVSGQGNPGGQGIANTGSGGGGGGAGSAGGNARTPGRGGNGGSGYQWVNSITYAGGGGGGSSTSGGPGGAGGGGSGIGTAGNASPGTGNTGGGGGGASNVAGYSSGNGGPGIVIIRYAI